MSMCVKYFTVTVIFKTGRFSNKVLAVIISSVSQAVQNFCACGKHSCDFNYYAINGVSGPQKYGAESPFYKRG